MAPELATPEEPKLNRTTAQTCPARGWFAFSKAASLIRACAVRGVAVLLCLGLAAVAGDLKLQRVPPGTRIQDLRKLDAQPATRADVVADAGDFFRMPDGREIRLLRATDSAAIAFSNKAERDRGLPSLQSRKGIPAHSEAARAQFRKGASFHIMRAKEPGRAMDPKSLQAEPSVAYARHVLVEPKSRTRMIATDELLAAFRENVTAAQMRSLAANAGLQIVAPAGGGKVNAWRLRLLRPKTGDPLQVSRTLGQTKGVLWAQPNFLREIKHCYTPPNPLFNTQQALRNLGLNHAVAGADARATSAWDRTTGNSSVVIAIIDDGVDITHPGLRIFTNPGESGGGKEANTVDDDGNGFADDVHGWDFANNDNNPSPVSTNGHGTGTAGIAAGNFSVAAKTAGIAGGCTILPVKIADDTGNFASDVAIGSAIIYASTFADVLSNSWGGGSESPFIDAAIDYAVAHGRGGKGCPVFFATGNYASTWMSGGGRFRLSTTGLNGGYYYSFYYEKGATDGGENAVRIDNVCLLDADGYTHKTTVLPDQDFETWFYFPPYFNFPPVGWWLSAGSTTTPYWAPSATNALTGTGGTLSAMSPALASGQYTWLISPLMNITGNETFAFAASISIPVDSYLFVPVYDANLQFVGYYGPFNGLPDAVAPDSLYPASYLKTIAVGAATDCDRRSDYSGYAGHLDFLAPSNGGWNDIATLDPVGAVGWTPDDYKMNFGGTSAATPLAAGIAALMLSVNPTLTEAEIRNIMHATCDKVGGVTYTAGTHPEYGYGRVNAAKAVESAMPSLSVNDVTINEGPAAATVAATFTVTLSAATVRDVTVQFNTVDGTAVAGTNYTNATGTLTFLAGSTTAQVNVSVNGGTLAQPSANFLLRLSNATNATILRSNGKCTITPLDTDGDGMPDYWELLYRFNPLGAADAALDADGDGISNLQEFRQGSNPRDPADPLSITAMRTDGADFFLTFKSVAQRTYRIEYKDALTDSTWLPLGSDITATSAATEVQDPGIVGSQPSRFYRARLLP